MTGGTAPLVGYILITNLMDCVRLCGWRDFIYLNVDRRLFVRKSQEGSFHVTRVLRLMNLHEENHSTTASWWNKEGR